MRVLQALCVGLVSLSLFSCGDSGPHEVAEKFYENLLSENPQYAETFMLDPNEDTRIIGLGEDDKAIVSEQKVTADTYIYYDTTLYLTRQSGRYAVPLRTILKMREDNTWAVDWYNTKASLQYAVMDRTLNSVSRSFEGASMYISNVPFANNTENFGESIKAQFDEIAGQIIQVVNDSQTKAQLSENN